MSSDLRPEESPPPRDNDDEIVALSNALKDQVRRMKSRLRVEGIKGEAPSFTPERDDDEP